MIFIYINYKNMSTNRLTPTFDTLTPHFDTLTPFSKQSMS